MRKQIHCEKLGLKYMAWVGVLSPFSTVAMNDGVVPIVFGTTAIDGIVLRGCWLSSLFFTQDLKP